MNLLKECVKLCIFAVKTAKSTEVMHNEVLVFKHCVGDGKFQCITVPFWWEF